MDAGGAKGDNPPLGVFWKVLGVAVGAVVGALLGALVWYLVLELVGVEGITRYAKEPVHQSYLWQATVIYAGPAIGMLVGSVLGWRVEAGTHRSEGRR
jgi:hypothetical protein